MMNCHICGHEFMVGDGYAFFRDDTERICKKCHAEWFGSRFRQEYTIQPGEIPPETAEMKMARCVHQVQHVQIDPAGGFIQVCQDCGRQKHV